MKLNKTRGIYQTCVDRNGNLVKVIYRGGGHWRTADNLAWYDEHGNKFYGKASLVRFATPEDVGRGRVEPKKPLEELTEPLMAIDGADLVLLDYAIARLTALREGLIRENNNEY